MLETQERITYQINPFEVAREVLIEKRNAPESEEKFHWLDFLEEIVLSSMSIEWETLRGEETDLPPLRQIEWTDSRTYAKFEELWRQFQNAKSQLVAEIKLERLFLLYKHRGKPFDLRELA